MEKKSPDLVIVYDKKTEKAANGISGTLAGTYTCLVQKDKVFESNKNSYTNNNKILFLSDDLIFQYLGMGKSTEYVIKVDDDFYVYANVISLGNWRGIVVNIDKTVKSLPKRDAFNYYMCKYFVDFAGYIFTLNRPSKVLFEATFYDCTIEFFLKKENRKLIIPE